MHRRAFLQSTAAAGLGLISAAVLPPLAVRAAESDIVDVTLEAKPYLFAPLAGVKFRGFAYNGQMPGPLIRLRQGQTLRARLVNRTGNPSTIHWHGMILPNDMDGVEGVTQQAVPSGADFTYSFKAEPAGLRWYHSHVMPQEALGLFGPLIVDDPKDEHADVELVAVLHDAPDMRSFMAAVKGQSNAPMIGPKDAPEMAMEMGGMHRGHGDMSGMKMPGMSQGDGMKMTMAGGGHGKAGAMPMIAGPMMQGMGDEVAFVARAINGACYPHGKPTLVKVGQLVRLRLLNASPSVTHYVRLAGHKLTVSHSDGNRLPATVEVDVLRLGPAERYDAWFQVGRPGAWLLQAIASDRMAAGQALLLHTPGMARAKPMVPPPLLHGAEVFSYARAGDAIEAGNAPFPGHFDVRQDFVLSGGEGGGGAWMINGKVWPDTPKVHARRGDRVLIRFRNDSDMEHPMHLHGHVFDLVEIGGKVLKNPLPKDTVLVPKGGGTASWAFTANSPPGRWLLHCHNSVHMMAGMMTEVDYA
ncbi:MAG TPA: multicopper oxidase family protein [Candidatus Sulfotelmatobacter sp.]|nr:multicopper oxidase family protein [Candidatus Sulfotelmatobacter sp.]